MAKAPRHSSIQASLAHSADKGAAGVWLGVEQREREGHPLL